MAQKKKSLEKQTSKKNKTKLQQQQQQQNTIPRPLILSHPHNLLGDLIFAHR